MDPVMSPRELTRVIHAEARQAGFDLCGIAPAVSPPGFAALERWVKQGYAAEMQYIPDRLTAYAHPENVLPGVRNVVVLAVRYSGQATVRHAEDSASSRARVARYAQGSEDYHDVLRRRLRSLSDRLHELAPGCRTRGVVDTAPLLERDFARLAGLGWYGKNTMLINKWKGSQFFLSAILTDLELIPDAAHETDHCGTCTRCLDACPTEAFPEPGVLDAGRCISYLTIELRHASIPLELREGVGDWVFGCDVCQDVCPWNRKSEPAAWTEFMPVPPFADLDPAWLLTLTSESFTAAFRGTPMTRSGRAGMLRNALIVVANQERTDLVPEVSRLLTDDEPLIRGAAAWAMQKLLGEESLSALQSRLQQENNADVKTELRAAIRSLTNRPALETDQ